MFGWNKRKSSPVQAYYAEHKYIPRAMSIEEFRRQVESFPSEMGKRSFRQALGLPLFWAGVAAVGQGVSVPAIIVAGIAGTGTAITSAFSIKKYAKLRAEEDIKECIAKAKIGEELSLQDDHLALTQDTVNTLDIDARLRGEVPIRISLVTSFGAAAASFILVDDLGQVWQDIKNVPGDPKQHIREEVKDEQGEIIDPSSGALTPSLIPSGDGKVVFSVPAYG